jgi:aminoglycoside phosphotransferase family enzyme/predicted kinase
MVAIDTADSDQSSNCPDFTPRDLTPEAFPHPVMRIEVRETHISWVILTGPFAYKIKKSVRFDFLDASTLERRRALCEEELRLNRRLAGNIYLNVVPITREAGDLCVGGRGQVIEYAVRMKQFDVAQEMPALLARGAVRSDELIDLALRLAEFHRTAPSAPAAGDFPHTQQLHDAVLGNLATLLSHLDAHSVLPEMGPTIDWTHHYLRASLDALRSREQSGAIRECHGDLHARNIVRWAGRLIPFDCLEFDPKLRWIDVMNDVAFLVMDLTAHHRTDLAAAFLNAYVERTGDYKGLRHLGFYAVYRALVRAMVDGLAMEQSPARRAELQGRFISRIETAWGYVNHPPPTLFITHGFSGSGKSWLSERLVAPLSAVRIRSDVERKRIAKIGSENEDQFFGRGLYKREMTYRTYAHLLECAEATLKGGINTIIDATFLSGAHRRSFHELAVREGLRFIILDCQADPCTMVRRVRARGSLGTDPSDADAAILAQQQKVAEPLNDAERASALSIDTTDPKAYESALAAIRPLLNVRQA